MVELYLIVSGVMVCVGFYGGGPSDMSEQIHGCGLES